MTASSSGCTPLFLKAEPSSTGVIEMSSVAARMAAFSWSCSISSSARKAAVIVVVVIGERLDHVVAILLGLILQLGRDLALFPALPERVDVADAFIGRPGRHGP